MSRSRSSTLHLPRTVAQRTLSHSLTGASGSLHSTAGSLTLTQHSTQQSRQTQSSPQAHRLGTLVSVSGLSRAAAERRECHSSARISLTSHVSIKCQRTDHAGLKPHYSGADATMVGMHRCRRNSAAAPASELGCGVDQLGQQAIDAHLRVHRCTSARVHGCMGTRVLGRMRRVSHRCVLGAAFCRAA